MKVLAGHRGQSQEVTPLPDEYDYADSGGKPDDHGRGNEADHRPHFCGAHEHQDDTRHERCDFKARDAVFGGDASQDGDERARWACDLHTAAAEQRDARTTDDRGVEPLFGTRSRGNRKRHCQGKGHDTDDEAGDDIGQQLVARKQTRAARLEQGNHRQSGPGTGELRPILTGSAALRCDPLHQPHQREGGDRR